MRSRSTASGLSILLQRRLRALRRRVRGIALPSAGKGQQMFRLLRYFSLCSALVIAVMTAALTHIFIANDRLISQEATEERAIGVAKLVANATGSRIREVAEGAAERLRDPNRFIEMASRLERELSALRQGLPIVEIDVRNPAGGVLASSQLGSPTFAPEPAALARAVANRKHVFVETTAPFDEARSASAPERRLGRLYLPVLDAQRRVIAVLEVVLDVTVDARLSRLQHVGAAAAILASFLSLYAALFLLVRNADRTLRRQYHQLESLNSTLELRVAERAEAAERAADRAKRYNARLLEEVEQRRRIEDELMARQAALMRQQSALSGVMASGLLGSGRSEELIRAVTSASAGALDVDRVSVWQFAAGRNQLTCLDAFERSNGQHRNGTVLRRQDAPRVLQLLQDGKELIFADVRGSAVAGEFGDVSFAGPGTRSAMAVPVIHDGRVEGFICAEARESRAEWLPEQRLFAAAAASVVAVVLEGSERDRVETELRGANRSLAQAAKAKSLFLANMSHEIRTPMNGVLGMTELLMRTTLDGHQTRLVSQIGQSAKSLLTVINDILDVSRMEAGKLELERRPFDLRTCLEAAVEVLAAQAHAKDLELGVVIDPDVPARVRGDDVRLRQICLNLVGNSVKFTERGEISLAVVSMRRPDGKADIELTFRDTGIGIDPSRLDRVVSPYAQADNSISRRFGGSGLGLSICRQLTALMGGTMKITSEPGKGTTVVLCLPLETCPEAEDESRPLAARRIALVGPAGIWRAGAANCARAAGAAAVECDGPDTATLAEVDVALLDVRSIAADPGAVENCRGAAKEVRVVGVGPMSKSAMMETAGLDGFLAKPISQGALIEAVQQALKPRGSKPQKKKQKAPARSRAKSPVLAIDVLVAEDNEVNIEVACAFLAELGCRFTLAKTGTAAVAAAQRSRFDVILMDWEMPEMDGLAATQAIRAAEAAAGRSPVPIIAVTSHAFDEDKRRCTAAGMTGYLSKPYRSDQLAVALQEAVGPRVDASAKKPARTSRSKSRAATTVADKRAAPIAPAAVLDDETIGPMRKARPQLLQRLLQTYLETSPTVLAEIAAAITAADLATAGRLAHGLKSSSATLGARALSKACADLERAAFAGSGDDCVPLLAAVRSNLAEVSAEMSRLGLEIERENAA